MHSVLFVVSIFNYHREVEPVIREFVAQDWTVTVLLGWVGVNAEIAAEVYTNMGCHVLRTPYEHSYREASTSAGNPAIDKQAIPPYRKSLPLRKILKTTLYDRNTGGKLHTRNIGKALYTRNIRKTLYNRNIRKTLYNI